MYTISVYVRRTLYVCVHYKCVCTTYTISVCVHYTYVCDVHYECVCDLHYTCVYTISVCVRRTIYVWVYTIRVCTTYTIRMCVRRTLYVCVYTLSVCKINRLLPSPGALLIQLIPHQSRDLLITWVFCWSTRNNVSHVMAIVHCTVYTVHCIMYTVHCSVYNVQYTRRHRMWLCMCVL